MLVVVIVLLIFGLMSPLAAKFTPELLQMAFKSDQFSLPILIPPPTVADAVGQYVKDMSQFGIILALLMAMGAVALEKDKGTAAITLVKPMPRPVFLISKFLALGLSFTVGLALSGMAAYYYTLILFEPLAVPAWLALNGLMLLYVLVYTALTLLCSTLTRSQVVAGGLAVGILILMGLIGVIPQVGEALPGQLLAWGAGMQVGSVAPSWTALVVSVGLVVAALVGAALIFERQEL
jgi:ABC-2 type transport system permease protein